MAGSLSDDLFIGSIISLLIWGCTSGIFTRFNLTHTEDRYIQPPDAEEYFSPKPDKKPLLHAFRSFYFITAVLGFAASVVVSYFEF
ncbi:MULTISPECIES: hypothetical protein [unclassified Paenibacillus]|uniref:hypothetical protein n=1 Tax=unclassified Paenibacillus TaxID=185978 RepID=UPI00020D78BE|nr:MULTISPECIES: hypothetical protein [unclassified Paenibacillus]EGL17961.1 hypothetical protein HMPREF9413_4176 [Paenibacillus sp. HGF7]EPD81651.1 hypothetical protein HMPREF1207_05409 [Paenibacillus sp. HGH0039]